MSILATCISLMTMLLLNVQRCKTRPSNSRDYVSTPCMYTLFILILSTLTFHPVVILLYFLHQPTTSDEPTKAPATEGNQGTRAPSKGPSVSPSKGPSVSPTKEVSLLKSSLNISCVHFSKKDTVPFRMFVNLLYSTPMTCSRQQRQANRPLRVQVRYRLYRRLNSLRQVQLHPQQ